MSAQPAHTIPGRSFICRVCNQTARLTDAGLVHNAPTLYGPQHTPEPQAVKVLAFPAAR